MPSTPKSGRRALPLAALAATLMLIGASSARASTVTIGSPLTASFALTVFCGGPCTLGQLALPGATVASPSDGTIVRWRVKSSPGPGGGFKLRVLHPAGFETYTGAGTSTEGSPSGFGTQVFATDLPIHAGDLIGLDPTVGENLGWKETPESTMALWLSPLADGSTIGPDNGAIPYELAFNADVQPLPGISSLSPASGPTAGGTSVTIAGHDFTGATEVSFGSVPATSFTVDSDTQITAVSPRGSRGEVDVGVKNPGQSPAVAADTFTYTACVVPKLRGKSVRAAKNRLKKADCKLGKVKHKKGRKGRKAKVIGQSAKPGKVFPSGKKIKVTVG
jgi:IPT/TIG domain/PASTA domain